MPNEVPPAAIATPDTIMAKLDQCLTKVDAMATLLQGERMAIANLSNHVQSLHRGVPPTWQGRFALVCISAGVGAASALALIACTR